MNGAPSLTVRFATPRVGGMVDQAHQVVRNGFVDHASEQAAQPALQPQRKCLQAGIGPATAGLRWVSPARWPAQWTVSLFRRAVLSKASALFLTRSQNTASSVRSSSTHRLI